MGQETRLAPFDHSAAAHTSSEDTHTEMIPWRPPRKHIWPTAGRPASAPGARGGRLVHRGVALAVAHAPLLSPCSAPAEGQAPPAEGLRQPSARQTPQRGLG